ncbi:coiled-coil domain-containing protein 93 isoform X1 [Mangifera indica]|uniref:coiled-coil domain-containing protein 93 isoform X1 n=1 Tax=Mangifera indica TaxID=29780 RepID=UPI001CFB6480|nr:coiled-coil domain-containing protein 93 isoform X1 [Mangifera indica]XP_044463116.1 coiled-coil domain-containing protein 93 isoform X1 [Mangifera indica]XP_044463117.1 coiled-coil domain-containing protein 93 isoform X1 [Mangifera indica]
MEFGDHLEASEIKNFDIETELQCLRERINKEDANDRVEKLKSAIESLKALEKKESDLQSNCNAQRCKLEAEVIELEKKLAAGYDGSSLSDDLSESIEKLNLAKRELAARLRDILCLKRKLGDVPSHPELIQYERRFSELYTHIQEKHQKTQKYYATYNALMEIKELMLKETSLLNSISSQFQDAITSPAGRMKLIDSMEKIVKGSQQKLEKVQLGLREEQKACDALKERHAAAIAEQRRCHSLLKAFQEECAENERLRIQRSV